MSNPDARRLMERQRAGPASAHQQTIHDMTDTPLIRREIARVVQGWIDIAEKAAEEYGADLDQYHRDATKWAVLKQIVEDKR